MQKSIVKDEIAAVVEAGHADGARNDAKAAPTPTLVLPQDVFALLKPKSTGSSKGSSDTFEPHHFHRWLAN